MSASEPVRILMIDDHQVLRQGLRFMLRNQPDLDVVAEADDGESGLQAIAEHDVDLVLLDLNMPNVDGLAALAAIRARWPDLHVIVFTMYDDPEYIEAALQAGADGYLLKSVGEDELIRAVRAVQDGHGYLQSEVTRPVLERMIRAPQRPVEADLTPRERQILEALAEGHANKQIAAALGLAEATVKGYLSDLFVKLGASDRAHAVALALRSRLID